MGPSACTLCGSELVEEEGVASITVSFLTPIDATHLRATATSVRAALTQTAWARTWWDIQRASVCGSLLLSSPEANAFAKFALLGGPIIMRQVRESRGVRLANHRLMVDACGVMLFVFLLAFSFCWPHCVTQKHRHARIISFFVFEPAEIELHAH